MDWSIIGAVLFLFSLINLYLFRMNKKSLTNKQFFVRVCIASLVIGICCFILLSLITVFAFTHTNWVALGDMMPLTFEEQLYYKVLKLLFLSEVTIMFPLLSRYVWKHIEQKWRYLCITTITMLFIVAFPTCVFRLVARLVAAIL